MRRPKAKSTPLAGRAPLGSLPANDSETTLERDRSMDMPNAKDLTPPSLPVLEYEVVRHRGHWRVLHIGKHSAPCDSQDAAIAAAIAQAKESIAQGRLAQVRLKRTDGDERLIDLDSSR
jgi:hypothetical protein